MIKYVPRWIIFQDRGVVWVCKKPGGGMARGNTIQEAKDNFKKRERLMPTYDDFEDFLDAWGDE